MTGMNLAARLAAAITCFSADARVMHLECLPEFFLGSPDPAK